jgi:hypothetical protein
MEALVLFACFAFGIVFGLIEKSFRMGLIGFLFATVTVLGMWLSQYVPIDF